MGGRFQALLLDKDGTILDFEATWGRATLLVIDVLAGGDPVRAEALVEIAMIDRANARFDPRSPLVAGSAEDFGADWARVLGFEAGPAFFGEIDRLYRVHGRSTVTALPGAIDAVRRAARAGLPLGLATNDAEANALENLADLGIGDLFAFVAGYDSGHGAKPGPGMVLAYARHLGVDPGRVAMIGDSRHDLDAARAAGAFAVAVATGTVTAADLAPHADAVYATLSQAVADLAAA